MPSSRCCQGKWGSSTESQAKHFGDPRVGRGSAVVRFIEAGANTRSIPRCPVPHPLAGGLAPCRCGRGPALSSSSPEEGPESRDVVSLPGAGRAYEAAVVQLGPCPVRPSLRLASLASCSRCAPAGGAAASRRALGVALGAWPWARAAARPAWLQRACTWSFTDATEREHANRQRKR